MQAIAHRPVDVLRAQGQGIGPGTRTGPGEAGPGAVIQRVWDENYHTAPGRSGVSFGCGTLYGRATDETA